MKQPEQIVVKVGTTTLTRGSNTLSKRDMLEIAGQLAKLHEMGKKVVLVTSGSIFAGREVLHQSKIDSSLPGKQMLSSVGQPRLMQIWAELFNIFGISVGQLLLTKGDFSNRQGYLNVRNTLESLLRHGIIPIINENDSVATREIQVGDNDNLSALVANLIAADLLILLTDQQGLYTSDPTRDPAASLIPEVKKIDSSIFELAGQTRKPVGLGAGGMYTKIEAAQLASQSGTPTVIASSLQSRVILDIVNGKKIGTYFHTETTPMESRKRWLLSETPQGRLMIDAGAEKKLLSEGASLLPVGIQQAEGRKPFERGAVVQVCSLNGKTIATGIANYSLSDIQQILGRHSNEIEGILGYTYGPEVMHRDNMALLSK